MQRPWWPLQESREIMQLTVIVMTFNEERHLARCLSSVRPVASDIVVVDCFSSDRTVEIARQFGAKVLEHEWTNHAEQFNWALTRLPADTEWVFRVDADEYLTPALTNEIHDRLPMLGDEIDGVYVNRRMTFLGREIRHGGVFPVRILRIFRHGRGRCENRWMDEHIKVAGRAVQFEGELIDDNLNSLTWWTDKHNKYASREVVDLLNVEYQFAPRDSVASLHGGEAGLKRWIKERVYARLPRGWRAFGYFFYRYVLRFGFLDGPEGSAFHVLQGFWYRYLVDAKIGEIKRYMYRNGVGPQQAIEAVLGIKV